MDYSWVGGKLEEVLTVYCPPQIVLTAENIICVTNKVLPT